MPSPIQKERRLNFRSRTTFALPICVRLEGTDKECFARLYDVSEKGLGMIVTQAVAKGDMLWVITLRNNLRFRVLWSHLNEEEGDTFLCGLEPVDGFETFLRVFGKFIF